MVSNIFYFQPYLGKISNLTNIFQTGWNHQLDTFSHSLVKGVASSIWQRCVGVVLWMQWHLVFPNNFASLSLTTMVWCVLPLSPDPPQPICSGKGNLQGRRIDYVFANSPAISTIFSFHLDNDVPIPTHHPLVFQIQVIFSTQFKRPRSGFASHQPSFPWISFFLGD